MADASGELLRLRNWRELFVDHYLIDRLEGASLKLHEPQPAGTAIKYDRPWEGRGCAYITVLKDDGVYRMYYRALSGTVQRSPATRRAPTASNGQSRTSGCSMY